MKSPDAYKAYTGHFAWPTLLLTAAVALLFLAAWVGVLSDTLPLWVGSAMSTLAAYLGFTVMHEASHGNIHGRRRGLVRFANALGWIAGVPLLAPYGAFRALHLRHHSHTNHTTKDPDFFVAGSPWTALLRCATTLPRYYFEFGFKPGVADVASVKKERLAVIATVLVYAGLSATLIASGLALEWALLWLLPALLATTVLAFLFDYLPHHPHNVRERFHDTRAIDVRWLDALMLGQNLHLIHHLYPRVPFYRYRAAFDDHRPDLEARGAPIVTGLTARPVRSSAE